MDWTRPGDADYDDRRVVFNAMIDKRPRLIASCETPADVGLALDRARADGLAVAIRSGGHAVAGQSVNDDGLVIDVRPMKAITIDPVARTARVGAGCTWGEFDAAAQVYGLATTGGRVSTTGVSGLTLGGGSGWLEREHGLSCDNLLAVELVTADGRELRADEHTHSELLWACKGGGGNFGVVTATGVRPAPGRSDGVGRPPGVAGRPRTIDRSGLPRHGFRRTCRVRFRAGLVEWSAGAVHPCTSAGPAHRCRHRGLDRRPLNRSRRRPAAFAISSPRWIWSDQFPIRRCSRCWTIRPGCGSTGAATTTMRCLMMRSTSSSLRVPHVLLRSRSTSCSPGAARSVRSPRMPRRSAGAARRGSRILSRRGRTRQTTSSNINWVRDYRAEIAPYTNGGTYLNFIGDEGR